MFRVGMKVECINDNGADLLQKGQIYTVTKVTGMFTAGSEFICISNGGGSADGGWHASRFRPVVERKTDISVFTEILRRASTHTPVGG